MKDILDSLVITDPELLDQVATDDYDDYYEAYHIYENKDTDVKDDFEVEEDAPKTAFDENFFAEAVKALEENENEVECCECGELFPKGSSVKLANGRYLCGRCYHNKTEKARTEDPDEVTAPCSWCGHEYPINELHQEVDLGWLCDKCEQAIKSRGEELVFKEGCEEDA